MEDDTHWKTVGFLAVSKSGKVLTLRVGRNPIPADSLLIIWPAEIVKMMDRKKDYCTVSMAPPKDLPSPEPPSQLMTDSELADIADRKMLEKKKDD